MLLWLNSMRYMCEHNSFRVYVKLPLLLYKLAKAFYANNARVHIVKAEACDMRAMAKFFEVKLIVLADNRSIFSIPKITQIFFAKKIALRRGIWFRALNRLERGIMDLTARCVAKIKSVKLARIISSIIEKLNFAAESIIERMMKTVGYPLAQKTSLIAQSWGHRSAFSWVSESRFARYLAAMSLNSRGNSWIDRY
jgi:hypothetical protein